MKIEVPLRLTVEAPTLGEAISIAREAADDADQYLPQDCAIGVAAGARVVEEAA